MNDCCKTCGLYEKSEYPFCQPRGNDCKPWTDLYVVTNRIGTHERSVMMGAPHQWVEDMLKSVGISYTLDSVVSCAHDKPTDASKQICAENFLLPRIKKAQPRAILCLGVDAARAVLGSRLPIGTLAKAGIQEGPYGIPVVVADHPANHSSFAPDNRNGRDLREDYKRAFSQIHSVFTKGWSPPKLEYEVVSTPAAAIEYCDKLAFQTAVIAWDTEFGVQPGRNITHDSTKILCTGAAHWDPKSETYKVVVFDCLDWDLTQRFKLFSSLLRNTTVIGTYVKIDLQIAYFHALYNCYAGADKIAALYDTGQIRWLMDQEKAGNGLEEQAVSLLGASPWKYKVDDILNRIKAERTIPLEDGLTDYDYRHLPRDFRNEYQAWDLYWQARLWWEHYAHPDNPCHLKDEYNGWPWKRTQAFTEFLCYCERIGLILDMDYLRLYREVMGKKSDYVYAWLQKHPLVEQLRQTPNPRKPITPVLGPDGEPQYYKTGPRKGEPKVTGGDPILPEEFNPTSPTQMGDLVEYLGIQTVKVTDQTKRPKIDARELLRQANPGPGEEPNGRHHFFNAILEWRRYQKQISSFIDPFIQYAVPAAPRDGLYEMGQMRAHPMFKMSKITDASGTDVLLEGGVDSGRVSSTNPCGTNIDKKPAFRRSFPAPEGWVCWEEDQASIEPRVLAYNSNCKSWINVFKLRDKEPDNPDADLYKVEWRNFMRTQGKTWYQAGDVTKEERQQCKPLLLGAMYEATAYGVHQRDNVPLDIAEEFMKRFWESVPEIQAYNAEARRKCFEGEPIVSTSGRICKFAFKGNYEYDHDRHKHLPLSELQAAIGMPEEDAHIARKLENFLTQSTAKDITDVSAIELTRLIIDQNLPWVVTNNTMHDSIWGYVQEDYLEQWYHVVRRVATDVNLLTKWGIRFNTDEPVLLAVEMKAGPHLGAMAEIHFPTPKKIPGMSWL